MIVPDQIEPIVAWRVWQIGLQNILYPLCNSLAPYGYQPNKPFKAKCFHFGDGFGHSYEGIPIRDCVCGIYAAKDIDHLRRTRPVSTLTIFGSYFSFYARYAVGQVLLWGKIIEHDWGYRAEFAYPKELYVSSVEKKNALEEIYPIPVHLAYSWREVREHIS